MERTRPSESTVYSARACVLGAGNDCAGPVCFTNYRQERKSTSRKGGHGSGKGQTKAPVFVSRVRGRAGASRKVIGTGCRCVPPSVAVAGRWKGPPPPTWPRSAQVRGGVNKSTETWRAGEAPCPSLFLFLVRVEVRPLFFLFRRCGRALQN